MEDALIFADRAAFRVWLMENGESGGGRWLLFGKAGGPPTLGADEALEEALCFGWIDGQMKSLDGQSYIKYFAPRRPNSKWSEKNKALVAGLEQRGLMAGAGRESLEEAKKNGRWDEPPALPLTEEDILALNSVLEGYEPAYTNFLGMSPSVQKTYARGYYDAKTPAGRAGRLAWMIDRLNRNLKPM